MCLQVLSAIGVDSQLSQTSTSSQSQVWSSTVHSVRLLQLSRIMLCSKSSFICGLPNVMECVVLAVGGGGGTWLYQSVRFPGSLSGTPGYVHNAMQYLREKLLRFETHLCMILFSCSVLLPIVKTSSIISFSSGTLKRSLSQQCEVKITLYQVGHCLSHLLNCCWKNVYTSSWFRGCMRFSAATPNWLSLSLSYC